MGLSEFDPAVRERVSWSAGRKVGAMRALTLKVRMDSTHFLTKTKPRFATEMALHVLAYNLPRVLNIMGSKAILKAIAS